MKLRQVAIAARTLAPFRTQAFEAFGIEQDFKDPGVGEFGLENSVMAIGDSFFEIVAPTKENTAAGRTLDKANADACGYMLLFQVENFTAFDAHLESKQLRKVWHIDREEVSACHIHPKDMGGAIVSFDEMRPPESWLWGGPNWQNQRANLVSTIQGCAIAAPDPNALANAWSDILMRPVVAPDPATQAEVRIQCDDDTFIDFLASASAQPYLHSMTLLTNEPTAVTSKDQPVRMGSFEIHIHGA